MNTDLFTVVNKYQAARLIAIRMVAELDGRDLVRVLMEMSPVLSWSDEDILLELESRGLLREAIKQDYVKDVPLSSELALIDKFEAARLIAFNVAEKYNRLTITEPIAERDLILKWDDQTILQELKDRNLLDEALERKFVLVVKNT